MTFQRHRSLILLLLVGLSLLPFANGSTGGKANTVSNGLSATELYDRFIVKYRTGSAEQRNAQALQRSLSDAAARATPLVAAQFPRIATPLKLRHHRRLAVGADVVLASRKLNRAESTTLMQAIAMDPDVAYVEADALRKPFSSPNDPLYPNQWHLYETKGGINVPLAWDIATGTGVVIAVVDTGITPHSDLNANVLPGHDFISDAAMARDGNARDSNPLDQGDWTVKDECDYWTGASDAKDSTWHGTHVAGTIAAVANNSKGVAGVAYGAKIVPVRAFGKCGGNVSDIADAIVWASGGTVAGVPNNSNPAEVINLSFGKERTTCSPTEQNAIDAAIANGAIVVAAAGENGMASPGNCAHVIVVAGNARHGVADAESGGPRIDFVAPGVYANYYTNIYSDIYSASNAGTTVPAGETYAYKLRGSSMSAAQVSGVAALVQSVARVPLTQRQMERLLKSTASISSCFLDCGAGRIDAYAAVRNANTPQRAIFSVYKIQKITSPQDRTGVTVVSGHNAFQNKLFYGFSALPHTGSNNAWEFELADYDDDDVPDLYGISKMAASGKTEIHILGGRSDYQGFFLQKKLPLANTGTDSAWNYLVGDYNRDGIQDIYALKKVGGGSKKTEVHILNGADNFSTFLLHKALPLGMTGRDSTWVFDLGDYNADGIADLYAIYKTAASGKTEVHVLNGANAFSTFLLHVKTALGPTGNDNAWIFQTADYNGDNRADLYVFKRNGADGRSSEAHILNAAGNFQKFLLHKVMDYDGYAPGTDFYYNIELAEY